MKDAWLTPPEILEPIRDFAEGIDLDPCAPTIPPNSGLDLSFVNPKVKFTKEQDGLKQSWDYRTVFCNPPYSKPNLALWTEKCSNVANKVIPPILYPEHMFLLIPASTATKWWKNCITANAILFYEKRIKFVDPETMKQSGTDFRDPCLVYWGVDASGFYDKFEKYGWIVML